MAGWAKTYSVNKEKQVNSNRRCTSTASKQDTKSDDIMHMCYPPTCKHSKAREAVCWTNKYQSDMATHIKLTFLPVIL
ncbi:hypothetical protein B7P43_G03312 [Cryptotermes secundus]|uniref:Uncharacterized protein n=1 Tax=Cryptotermes secundus TaxID=105785 RepID=A0A2J7PIH7_9NEOP|nr:hypothetical protein B7P43_G03312 [Cryptotermes secundus]